MCRWLAFLGEPIRLESLLYRAEESFTRQSLHAEHSMHVTNGDGCGLGWYGGRKRPGLFRSERPAWNSANLRNLAEQIESPLFMAHVRASSGTAIQETNCHPFRFDNLLFQHNGAIRHFDRLKRDLDQAINPELYPLMEGSTDTERMFFLALTLGLQEDIPEALAKMVSLIEKLARDRDVCDAVIMTVAISDGEQIYAVRYSSGGPSPSLYHSKNIHAVQEVGGDAIKFSHQAQIVLSEPLDHVSDHWQEVPESTVVKVNQEGCCQLTPFTP